MLRVRTLAASEILIGDERIGPERRSAFVLLFLLATRSPAPYARRELGSLLWPDAADRDRNHRLRSLLHRLRRLGVPLACSGAAVALVDVSLDCAAFARPPRTLAEVRDKSLLIGPVLPDLDVRGPAALADRLDDERDAIVGSVLRWLRASLLLATSGGEWPLVERLARLTLAQDGSSEDAWLKLAEAQLMIAGSATALRTLDDCAARLADEPSLALRLLRRRLENPRCAPAPGLDDLPLIGRDGIMRRIWSAVARAREGHGGAVVLWGPAGVGKTRVLREVERVRLIESV